MAEAPTPVAERATEYVILQRTDDGAWKEVGALEATNKTQAVRLYQPTITEPGDYALKAVAAASWQGGEEFTVKAEPHVADRKKID